MQQVEIPPLLNMPECNNSSSNYIYGFKLAKQDQGKYFTGKNGQYHNIIFILEGELMFSYNNYLNRHFKEGEFFLVPAEAEVYSYSLTDTHTLILAFSDKVDSVCDNCALHKYSKLTHNLLYNFQPLKMTEQIKLFTVLIVNYIDHKTQCKHLNELKQKELFAILPFNYTSKELSEFFYPIISNELNFRAKVLKTAHNKQSIAEIAQELGMSSRTFSRKFSLEFGEPARYWLLKQKAQSIKLKLLIPGTTISDIMQEYKFADTSHFTKFCKEHYSCTPTELIKQIRENKIEK